MLENDPVNWVDPWGLYPGDEFDNNALDGCPCGTTRKIDWDCVSMHWKAANFGDTGAMSLTTAGVTGYAWSLSSLAGAGIGATMSGAITVWGGATLAGSILACSKCLPD